jgi:hypothetical protein
MIVVVTGGKQSQLPVLDWDWEFHNMNFLFDKADMIRMNFTINHKIAYSNCQHKIGPSEVRALPGWQCRRLRGKHSGHN